MFGFIESRIFAQTASKESEKPLCRSSILMALLHSSLYGTHASEEVDQVAHYQKPSQRALNDNGRRHDEAPENLADQLKWPHHNTGSR
jgi:hypothetical protein